MSKINCLYTEYFFKQMYEFCFIEETDEVIDQSGTIWHIDSIIEILVKEFNYTKLHNGAIVKAIK